MLALIVTCAASFGFGWLARSVFAPEPPPIVIRRTSSMGDDWMERGGVRERISWSGPQVSRLLDRCEAQHRCIAKLTDRLREKHIDELDAERASNVVRLHS